VLAGLTENHERSLLASVQYATRLIRDCDDVLAGASGSDPLSRYTKALSAPQEKIARDYLLRLREQLLRTLRALGIQPPFPSIGAVHALRTALMFLDDTFEEMRGRHLAGYGPVPQDADRVLDGVVSELQELTRDFETFLTGVADDVLRERLARLAATQPFASDVRELSRIIADHGLVDLRPALAVVVERALEDTFDVAIVGRVSSGKSSLVNALLGAAILPTGVLPVTAFPTRLRRGSEARLHVEYANGRHETASIDRIGEFVTETGNPGNEKRLIRLLVSYPSASLPAEVVFVDTPGLGSVTSGSALQTYAYLPRCDHATYLLDATAPVSGEDLTVLAFLHDAGITTSVLLSKADLLSSADLERVRGYASSQIEKRLGSSVSVHAMSTVPSHEALLREWIRDNVMPLGREAKSRAHDALARKIDVLRRQAIASLERALNGGSSVTRPELAQSVAGHLRDVSARLERTSRDLLSLHDRKAAILEAAVEAATQALAQNAAGESEPASQALRATLDRASQDLAAEIAGTLDIRAKEVEAILSDAAQATGAATPMLDMERLRRGVPVLDLPPLELELHPPIWTKASHGLLHRWITERVEQAWRPTIERTVDAYLDVLRRWANEGLTELRRQFEGHSRPMLSYLTGTDTPRGGSTGSTSAVQRDLAWLQQAHTETTHASHQ
jgi:GTP-binding protein EngB required for normal cell division